MAKQRTNKDLEDAQNEFSTDGIALEKRVKKLEKRANDMWAVFKTLKHEFEQMWKIDIDKDGKIGVILVATMLACGAAFAGADVTHGNTDSWGVNGANINSSYNTTLGGNLMVGGNLTASGTVTYVGAMNQTGKITAGAFSTTGNTESATFTNSGAAIILGNTKAGSLTVTGATALAATTVSTTLGVTGRVSGGGLTTTGTTVVVGITATGAVGADGRVTAGGLTTTGTTVIVGLTSTGAGTMSGNFAPGSLTTTGIADIVQADIDGISNSAAINIYQMLGSHTVTGTLVVSQLATAGGYVSTGLATLATVDIGAGAIDGTTIGANAAAAGSFTTLGASGDATVTGRSISGGITSTGTVILTSRALASITNKQEVTIGDGFIIPLFTLGATGATNTMTISNAPTDGRTIVLVNASGTNGLTLVAGARLAKGVQLDSFQGVMLCATQNVYFPLDAFEP